MNNNSDGKWVEVLQKDSYEGVFYSYRQGKVSSDKQLNIENRIKSPCIVLEV